MVRKHAFVSFTNRVAAIKIDPIRRTDRNSRTTDENSVDSLFIGALEKWNELNLASYYTTFSRQCAPLAQSLPMILYNQSRIFELLVNSLEATDEHSVEPLLDLLVNFARDLGEDFETYYARALKVCIKLIESNQQDDAKLHMVEMSFNCLAHIFKYLSRLITENLIPTYGLMLPLFGGVRGSKQRSFVLRFAAESMAFLVRRATGDSLSAIIDHIANQFAADPSNEQFLNSSSQLLAVALEGPQTGLHSKAPTLLAQYMDSCSKYNVPVLACYILVEALHHTRQDTSAPIYDTTLRKIRETPGDFGSLCLFVLAGTRKGDRVNDWNELYSTLMDIRSSEGAEHNWVRAAGAVISYADVVSTSKHLPAVLESCKLSSIVSLMTIVHEFNPTAIKAHDQKFWAVISAKCKKPTSEDLRLLSLLLLNIDFSYSDASKRLQTQLNTESSLSKVKLVADDDGASLLSLWWHLQLTNKVGAKGEQILRKLVGLEIGSANGAMRAFQSTVIAEVLARGVKLGSSKDVQHLADLTPVPSLLEGLRSAVVEGMPSKADRKALLESWFDNLLFSLMSCDKRYRAAAIELLKTLMGSELSLLDECSVINELPLDLQNARNISHRLRGLAISYSNLQVTDSTSQMLSRAVASFFFGMATVRLQPVSTTVFELVEKLAAKNPKDMCQMAMRFIEHPNAMYESDDFLLGFNDDEMDVESSLPFGFSDINCHTLSSLISESENSLQAVNSLDATLKSKATESIQFEHYHDLRLVGIKMLSQIPQIAEREAVPRLVPYLLQVEDEDEEETAAGANAANNEKNVPFTFSDKVALLELFGKVRNPERLPHFNEVYQRYLHFLGSRHAPLQRLGLKCLKTASSADAKVLRKYSSNFDALLDDKRFRDELTSFICASENQTDEGSLHPDDRSAILPFVVRVLYGRAQNSTKRNMRYAVLSSLHFLEPEFREMFISLAHVHLDDTKATSEDSFEDKSVARRVQGYLTLMNDVVHFLKSGAADVIPYIVTRGIFPILVKLDLTTDKTLRQLVTKTLDEMFTIVPKGTVWEDLYPRIYELLIEPQLEDFSRKNHENTSALMKLFLTLSGEQELVTFLDTRIISSLTSCLSSLMAKDSVIILVLRVIINMTTIIPASEVTQVGISSVVKLLPSQMERELSPECFSVAVETVNKIFAAGLDSFDAEIIENLAIVSFKTLQRPSRLVPLNIKSAVLLALSHILNNESCPLNIIEMAYETLAPLFRQFVDRDSRLRLSACYEVFGRRVPEYSRVGKLIVELNSFDSQRLGEPDFTRRSVAFEEINEQLWKDLTLIEWKPLMFNMLFFMKDPEELALRNNGKYALMRLIESKNVPSIVDEYVLPAIKKGLREPDEKFRRLYVDLLGQCAHFDVLPSLKVLLFRGDEEADFFININHVQVHRRRRAIQRLGKLANEIDENVIAHYLLSIVENFAALSGSKNSDVNNMADDALHAISLLLQHVSVGQFKSVARRCVQNVVQGPEPAKLRRSTRVMTAVAQATPRGIGDFVSNVLVAPLHRLLTAKSNEHENLPDRIPLAVAIVHFLKSLEEEELGVQLSGKLTSLCQLLRSKIPELRDTVRQTLGRIIRILGPRYLQFLVLELRGALRRGGLQSHVLGFTVHSLLVELDRRGQEGAQLSVGDTDESAGMIFRIVMDDTFGSIGEEKDNEGYVTASKEVKQHKSYDTAEILATWTSLSQFGKIIQPMREFLSENKLNSKNEHKIEAVLARLAAGLHKNPQAGTQDAVVMGYEIFTLCEDVIKQNAEATGEVAKRQEMRGALAAREEAARESQQFFTVRLSSRDWYDGSHETGAGAGAARYAPANLHLLETFALDTLRSVMTSTTGGATGESGKGLLTTGNVKGLAPIIAKGLDSTFEDLNIAALRLATMAFRLPVSFSEGDTTLERCGQRTFELIESSTDTNNLLCQAALKFLTMLIRHKPTFDISSKAVAYILEKVRPDLEEPERQGTAISFVRATFSKKIMLPQVYDVADTISKVLVTNQSDHIRVNCRTAYLQFLTSYPLGQSRLDRHLAALGANLRYAAPSGRLSVMEMIHGMLQKISVEQLEPAFVQYFASLVLIQVTDTEPACRERAKTLLQELVNAVVSASVQEQMVEYCLQWLGSLGKNDMLVRGGLEVASMLAEMPWASNRIAKPLENAVRDILKSGQRESTKDVDWQLVYLALDSNKTTSMIDLVEGVLLFPHPWVRSRATRIFGNYFKATPKSELSLDLLVRVGHKLVRQLGAPRLVANETLQIVKDLVFIIPIWDSEHATMSLVKRDESSNDGDARPCVEWLVHKLGSMIRTDVSAEDFIGSKTGAIQILASLPSLVGKPSLEQVASEAIRSLYVLGDQLEMEDVHAELRDLAQEAMSLYEEALGTTDYFKLYSEARLSVQTRRRERRTKRAVEAVADPEIAAQKRMKRNLHKRDVRKDKKRRVH